MFGDSGRSVLLLRQMRSAFGAPPLVGVFPNVSIPPFPEASYSRAPPFLFQCRFWCVGSSSCRCKLFSEAANSCRFYIPSMLTICGCLLCCRSLFGVFCCCRRVQDNDYRKGLEADRRRSEAQQEERLAKVSLFTPHRFCESRASVEAFTSETRLSLCPSSQQTNDVSVQVKYRLFFYRRQESGGCHVPVLFSSLSLATVFFLALVVLSLSCLMYPNPPSHCCVRVCRCASGAGSRESACCCGGRSREAR